MGRAQRTPEKRAEYLVHNCCNRLQLSPGSCEQATTSGTTPSAANVRLARLSTVRQKISCCSVESVRQEIDTRSAVLTMLTLAGTRARFPSSFLNSGPRIGLVYGRRTENNGTRSEGSGWEESG